MTSLVFNFANRQPTQGHKPNLPLSPNLSLYRSHACLTGSFLESAGGAAAPLVNVSSAITSSPPANNQVNQLVMIQIFGNLSDFQKIFGIVSSSDFQNLLGLSQSGHVPSSL